MTRFREYASPLGTMWLVANGDSLGGIYFADQKHLPPRGADWREDDSHPALAKAARQLGEYFSGARREFELPLAPRGTVFQQAVWAAIADVAYGERISYGELARRIGRADCVRAAGTATGRNPLGIVVPCHRIVGADGSLTGYAGGLDRKRALLALEARGGQSSPAFALSA